MSGKMRSLRRNLRKIKHKRVKNFIAQIINIFNYFKTKKITSETQIQGEI